MRLVLALLALLSAVPAAAATYHYTGAAFDTQFYRNSDPSNQTYRPFGNWQTDRLELTLTTPTPLAASRWTSFDTFSVMPNITLDFGAAPFSGSALGPATSIDLLTDASGNIVDWVVSAYGFQWGLGPDQSVITSSSKGDYVEFDYEFTYWDAELLTASSSNAGSWTRIDVVPLPASGLLLLGALGVLYWRRRRTA